jgi:uncharacterized repeat protein (TIGR03806 family)
MRYLTLLALVLLPATAYGEIRLPPEFNARQVARGITGATAMEIAPDGRIFVCEQTGAVRVFKNGELLERPFARLEVDSQWERGLLGIALDPAFAANERLYVCYVASQPNPHHRISRFTVVGDVAGPGSEVVLFEGDDQRALGGETPAGHQGGAMHFGADGMLYVALGDQTAGAPAQRMDSLLGKLLRLAPDGSIPRENPFYANAHGKYRAIWALGLRNPFTFAVQPSTGRVYLNDVGGLQEEINEGIAGANYGWPTVEHGPTSDVRFHSPVYWYPTSSITGGTFCDGRGGGRLFPPDYHGKYFFMDFAVGWIKVLDPDRPASPVEFASGLTRPVDIRFGPDGALYVLLRDAWVIDKDFRPDTGALLAIRYKPGAGSRVRRPTLVHEPPRPFPMILPPAGRYTGPIHVRLTLGGEVRYTLGGDAPTRESARYSEPFELTRGATVRARSFEHGKPSGPAVEATYVITGTTPYGLAGRPEVHGLKVSLSPAELPSMLSETGIFSSLSDLTPAPGIVPYSVINPLWSDGARKRRWVALPGGETIGFAPAGDWMFPRGTVFIKHFDLPVDAANPKKVRRLETRVLVVDEPGRGYGATYRWSADGRDAKLLHAGANDDVAIKTLDGSENQTWSYPARDDCLKCHTTQAGFVLGVKTRQLNVAHEFADTGRVDNQLRVWRYLGMLASAPEDEAISSLPRLAALDDPSSPIETRVRSYLDANCQHCHRPGGNIPAAFDARFDTPLAAQNLIGARSVSDSLGIISPRVVAPGDVGRSLLYQRMIQAERYKMPPLARNRVDTAAAEQLRAWIEGLPR